jgi:hypothetical protein
VGDALLAVQRQLLPDVGEVVEVVVGVKAVRLEAEGRARHQDLGGCRWRRDRLRHVRPVVDIGRCNGLAEGRGNTT